nr:hypothetical protein [Tanacetum cinerariifolium]
MMLLSTSISSRFSPTNNQLKTSSNPRTQTTIQDGRVTIKNVQGRRSQGYRVNNITNGKATRTGVINTVGDVEANQPMVIMCYNCKGIGHIVKQCTAKKRVKDSKWFKEKMFLAQAQEAGVIFQEEQQDFLADGLEDLASNCDDLHLHTTSIFKADHVDAFDLDCDKAPTGSANFMARLSLTCSINGDVVDPTYDSNILFEELSEKHDKYIDEILVLGKDKKKLQSIVYKTCKTVQTMHMLTKYQAFYDDAHKTALGYQNPLYLHKAQQKQLVLYNANV